MKRKRDGEDFDFDERLAEFAAASSAAEPALTKGNSGIFQFFFKLKEELVPAGLLKARVN